MVSIETVLIIVALVLAVVEEIQARGISLLGWAVIVLCAALLWGVIH